MLNVCVVVVKLLLNRLWYVFPQVFLPPLTSFKNVDAHETHQHKDAMWSKPLVTLMVDRKLGPLNMI